MKKEVKEISHEMEVSIKAGDIVGLLYDAFLKQYKVPETAPKDESDEDKAKRENKLRSLNALCVRLVFLLYAEDTDILGKRNMFHDFLLPLPVNFCRESLKKLFKVLDTPIAERDEYLEEEYAQFPYVNGGLFADEYRLDVKAEKEFKKKAESPSWDDLRRYPDTYKGKAVKLTLKMTKVDPDGLIFEGDKIGVYPNSDNEVALTDERQKKEPKYMEGDTVTFYGIADGTAVIKVKEGSGILAKTVDKYEIPNVIIKYNE